MARQQKRSIDRLEAILAAALRCFRAEGFHGASISRICAEAGISPGHLYHYFDSKEAIVEAIVQSDRERIRGMLDQLATDPDPVEALMRAILTPSLEQRFQIDGVLTLEIYAEAARNPRIAAIVNGFTAHAQASVASLLADLQRDGKVAADAEPDRVASFLISVAEGLMLREAVDPSHRPDQVAPYLRSLLHTILRDPHKIE